MRALSVLLGRGLLVLSLSSVAGLVGCGDDDDTVVPKPDGGTSKAGSSAAGKGGASAAGKGGASAAGKGGSSSAGKGGSTVEDGGVLEDAATPEPDAG